MNSAKIRPYTGDDLLMRGRRRSKEVQALRDAMQESADDDGKAMIIDDLSDTERTTYVNRLRIHGPLLDLSVSIRATRAGKLVFACYHKEGSTRSPDYEVTES